MLEFKEYPDGSTMILDGREVSSTTDVEGFRQLVSNPSGRILMGGLGWGRDVEHLLSFPAVTQLVVVEISAEVIDYCKLRDPRLTIIEGDFRYFNRQGFDLVIDSTGNDYIIHPCL